jgi:hypothetical protein
MTCLDIKDKIAMMIDQIQISRKMLNDDSVRPNIKQRVEEDLVILKSDLKEMYIELFKLQNLQTKN